MDDAVNANSQNEKDASGQGLSILQKIAGAIQKCVSLAKGLITRFINMITGKFRKGDGSTAAAPATKSQDRISGSKRESIEGNAHPGIEMKGESYDDYDEYDEYDEDFDDLLSYDEYDEDTDDLDALLADAGDEYEESYDYDSELQDLFAEDYDDDDEYDEEYDDYDESYEEEVDAAGMLDAILTL